MDVTGVRPEFSTPLGLVAVIVETFLSAKNVDDSEYERRLTEPKVVTIIASRRCRRGCYRLPLSRLGAASRSSGA